MATQEMKKEELVTELKEIKGYLINEAEEADKDIVKLTEESYKISKIEDKSQEEFVTRLIAMRTNMDKLIKAHRRAMGLKKTVESLGSLIGNMEKDGDIDGNKN